MSIVKNNSLIVLSIISALFFLFVGIFTLNDYGINWDEPAHYYRGHAYVRFFLTGEKDYSNLPKIKFHYPKTFFTKYPTDLKYKDDSFFRRSEYQYDEYDYNHFLANDRGHPPINGELAALSNVIFYQNLGLLGDIESHHLFIIVVSSLLIAFVFYFTAYHYGVFSGLVAAISLAVYPLFFAESHFNVKDPVITSFYSITLLLLYLSIVKNNWKYLLISSIFAGFALSTKFNVFFSILIVSGWMFVYFFNRIRVFKWPFSKPLTIFFIIYPIIAFGILFVSWPFLWSNPIDNFLKIIEYYKDIGYQQVYQPSSYFIFGSINTYPTQWILYTTPLVILFLSIVGVIYTIKNGFKEKHKFSLLVLFWFLVPILRVTMPNAGIYGGVRQIMEYIPAMAILSGIGAWYIVFLSKKYFKKNPLISRGILIQLIILFSFIPITLKLISIHPNENVYFNPLVGGLKGAKERNFADWGVTLGSAYKQGFDWLNDNAVENANAGFIRALLDAYPRSRIREDISFHKHYYSGEKREGEYLIELTDYLWGRDMTEEQIQYMETLIPVHEVRVDGVAILKIWKNDKDHWVK